ncbi:MAG: hypothetical protein NW217_09110 [Hyphomicrobiaceae bacterium]|nr:hypothetical protein [Hyphomicrobiaceae bacterium]
MPRLLRALGRGLLRASLPLILMFAVPAGTMAGEPPGRVVADADREFERQEAVLQFISQYAETPAPDKVPAAVRAMVRHGLMKDPEKAGVYTGFMAGIIGSSTDPDTLVATLFPMPPVEQIVLIKAIAFSGLADWKGLLGRFVERMPARKVILRKYLYGGGLTLADLPVDDPFVIDANWGYYFATGRAEPVVRIISIFSLAADGDDTEKVTLGAMAKFTYASNAARDTVLLDVAKAQMNSQPEANRRHLRDVIQAAELYELADLRDDAFKRIEDIRRYGSQAKRTWTTWGQAGTTALALGCVAASALGQVQLGIPCVVGGALSTAAVNYLGPDR